MQYILLWDNHHLLTCDNNPKNMVCTLLCMHQMISPSAGTIVRQLPWRTPVQLKTPSPAASHHRALCTEIHHHHRRSLCHSVTVPCFLFRTSCVVFRLQNFFQIKFPFSNKALQIGIPGHTSDCARPRIYRTFDHGFLGMLDPPLDSRYE